MTRIMLVAGVPPHHERLTFASFLGHETGLVFDLALGWLYRPVAFCFMDSNT